MSVKSGDDDDDVQCAPKDLGKCTENGQPDPDCCAMPGQGGCTGGYFRMDLENSLPCHSNGATTTCCMAQAQLSQVHDGDVDTVVKSGVDDVIMSVKSGDDDDDLQCAPKDLGKCTENGQPDPDCCAMPGQGGCTGGYFRMDLENSLSCHSNGATTTCCMAQA